MINLADSQGEQDAQNRDEIRAKGKQVVICNKCGRPGQSPEECPCPITCERCGQEGHVARVFSEKKAWDNLAPFCGLAAPGQGFFFIESDKSDKGIGDMSSTALITILSGEMTAKQVEHEFRMKAGPQSTWRWYAKKVGDKSFQLRFPNPRTIDDLAFYAGLSMGTLPEITFKVEKWNSAAGATGSMDSAWFRIRGIPYEKRSE